MSERDRMRRVIEECPLFDALDARQVDGLLEISRLQRFGPGETIFRKGEIPDRFCVLASGSAAVNTAAASGRAMQIRMLEAGDVFGEIGVFDGAPRTADIRARDACEAVVVERSRLRGFLLGHPEVSLGLLRVMAEKLRGTTALLEDAVFLSTPERIAKVLVSLVASHGVEDDEGTRIGLLLSQGALGNMAGCTRESVNRELARWSKAGLLSFDEGEVVIFDFDRLAELAR